MAASIQENQNTVYDDAELIKGELNKCIRCGSCMSVCPVYSVLKTEPAVARGKMAVIEAALAGNLAFANNTVSKILSNCLLCTSCIQTCTTKVNVDAIMLASRAALVRKKGQSWLKRILFRFLGNQKYLELSMKISSVGCRMFPQENKEANKDSRMGVLHQISRYRSISRKVALPEPAFISLRERLESHIPVSEPVAKAGFFTGCSMNFFYPEIGMDVVEVLSKNHVEISIPKQQGCCGMAVFASGDVESARMIARKNLDAVEHADFDYLIFGCGSCCSAWKNYYPELLRSDPVYGFKADCWSKRAYDISSFLVNIISYRKPKGMIEARVTYHDPCHLKKTLKVSQEPREIIKTIPGVVLREMENPDACCGMGGTYCISHYKTSKTIADRKMHDINKTEADMIVTGCPGCVLQLQNASQRSGKSHEVVHVVSLLAESYRKE